ncbi:hypothetical protein [Brevundimonas sp.]|uniref:hypothetical protein n=1 Tax=Brevundimonas sp. TaxID=1871086 RepID=UPI0028AE3F32|nr:hypothetical protein [Brevundimonas sp.]
MTPAAQIEKRRPLTRAEFGQLMIDQEGRCACGCGEKLQPMTEGVIDEHLRALALLGTNALENRALYRKPCARKKTDEQDTPRIAKAKAQAGETGQYARRQKRGQGSIQSRGFDKTRTKRFDGSVVARPQKAHDHA